MTSTIIISVVLGYFAILLAISFLTGKKLNNQSFFLANRKSPWYVVAFGMIGASLSGVTFISVPGWVMGSGFSYMQMVLGYLVGYAIIANVLVPIYYKLELTSIYTYLYNRLGKTAYKTGASFFLLSRTIGASFRLFLVANVLQVTVFDTFNIPFSITVLITVLLIWLYTFRGGIKTIIWTDTLQTFSMLLAAGLTVFFIAQSLEMNFSELTTAVESSSLSQIFFWDNIGEKHHFIKMFSGGILISVVMTGLDQDMMQKNLSCKNIKEAKKNIYWFSWMLIPVNILFLSLGVLLVIFATQNGITLPAHSDELYPLVASSGLLPHAVTIFFMLGLIAAAYSSADSALTSLTTSFTIDILEADKRPEHQLTRIRKQVHIAISIVLIGIIMAYQLINNRAIIDAIFTAAAYTYGPLLGLFMFALFTKYQVKQKLIPLVSILPPIICLILDFTASTHWNYQFGYEILLLNGIFTFIGLYSLKNKK